MCRGTHSSGSRRAANWSRECGVAWRTAYKGDAGNVAHTCKLQAQSAFLCLDKVLTRVHVYMHA